MTKTSTAAKITFPIVDNERVNAETGVKIVRTVRATYMVLCPTRESYDLITEERSLKSAREWATERVNLMREVIAEAYDEADTWIYDELNAAEMGAYAEGAPDALRETMNAAWRSYDAGFLGVATQRLHRVLMHWHGQPFPSNDKVRAAEAEARVTFAEHTIVKAERDPEGREWMVYRPPFVEAETGRIILALSTRDARHTRNAYADEVTVATV